VTVDGNETGVHVAGQGLATRSTHLSVSATGAGSAPVVLAPEAWPTLPKGGAYTGNANDWLQVNAGAYERSGLIPNLGVPYRVQGEISVRGDSAVFEIEAGTQFLMSADSRIEVGWNGTASKMTAIGTAEAPIVFRGFEATKGYWRGLEVGGNVLSDSQLRHVHVGHAGGGTGGANVRLHRPVDIEQSRFFMSAGFGIRKSDADSTDYMTANTFEDNELGQVGPL
jgi:hypothetical protein